MASGPRNAAPTKVGSFDFVHYCPAWTDPNWQDEGPERDASVFDIKDSVFDRLRPALLPRDNFEKPTVYAQRFGIFPGRTDGRSRTSPTRAESRQIFPASSDIRNGKELFERFEDLAKAANEHVDDYMERTRPDMQKLDETEQRFMQQYENLVIDENWQAILFGSVTMDELQAEGYFSMCDTKFDSLGGHISEVFERERWVDTSCNGRTADKPRLIYNLNGRREEWNPRTNDRVWDAMQPAIQLASRFIVADDPFISGLLDITNRLWLDPRLFQNQPGQDRDTKIRFVPDLDPNDPSRLKGAKAVIDSGINPRAATWQALLQTIKIELASGFICDGKQQIHHSAGNTDSWITYPWKYNLRVAIDCELVWPLINDAYSNSEKLKASLILATTIAHEMMHAFARIPYMWLVDPATVGIVRRDQVRACDDLVHSMYDHRHNDLHGEPYYDEDPHQEVGHVFEETVLGGGYWSFASDISMLKPALLQTAAGLVAFTQNSEGDRNEPPVLQYPLLRNVRLNHYIRTEDVQKYFTQSFWDVAVQKYGTAALREPSKRPHKLNYYPADENYNKYDFGENTLGTEEDMAWVQDFMRELGGRGNLVLWSYLNNLINEACEFDLMNAQFATDMMTWAHRDQIWKRLSREILTILCEISAYTYQPSQGQAKDDVLDSLYNLWKGTIAQRGGYPDAQSACLDNLSSDPETWAQNTRYSSLEVHEKRLLPRLMDFTRRIERELMHIESMVCELYQSGTSSWPLYRYYSTGHDRELPYRVDTMIEYITDLLTPIGIADRGVKSIDAEWFNRIWNLGRRFKDVRRLLDLDTRNYEHNWRDILLSMPMLHKSKRKPHQRLYFLAKKEMMKLTGSQLEKMKEFKIRFQRELSLGSYKVVIPGGDPDVLSIAQRFSGTLDDDRGGSNDHEKSIKGPSTGIFDIDAVKNLVHQLREEENDAQADILNRITNRKQSEAPTLQKTAAEQAGIVLPIPPKFQEVGFNNQAVPLNSVKEFKANNSPFSAFSSGTSSPFPRSQLNQPPAWAANSTGDLAAWVNHRLADVPPVAHGITPQPYALREDLTVDLQNIAQAKLPMRNPASFANEYPREVVQDQDSPFVAGPLGDIAQAWEKQYQPEQSPPPTATGDAPVAQSSKTPTRRESQDIDMAVGLSQGRKATVLPHFDHSSSETDVSDDEEQRTRESSSSGTTLIGLSDVEEELLSKIAAFEKSEAREKRYDLKRRSSWVRLLSKKKELEIPKAGKRVYKSKPKKRRVPRV